MTQLGLDLDRFQRVREMVDILVGKMADIESQEIHKLFESQRRSLGQTVRWINWRLAK